MSDLSQNIIVYESLTLLNIILTIDKIRSSKQLFYYEKNSYISSNLLLKKGLPNFLTLSINYKYLIKLIKLINSSIITKGLTFEDYSSIYYQLNKDCLAIIESDEDQLKANKLTHLFQSVLKDKIYTIQFYKAMLTMFYPKWLLFLKSADIINISNHSIILIPDFTSNDIKLLNKYIFHKLDKKVIIKNNISTFFTYYVYSFILLFTPIFKCIKHLKFKKRKFSKKKFKLAVPVVWGIAPKIGDHITNGVKRFNDDSYFYGNGLNSGDIIHILGEWKFSTSEEKKHISQLQNQNLPYIHKKDFIIRKISFKFILNCFGRIVSQIKTIPILSRYSLTLLYSNLKGMYKIIDKTIEIDNIQYAIEYVKSDYNPANILNTIILNNCNRKSIAISHAASPYDCPQLSYVYFHKYLTLCKTYNRTFGSYWKKDFIINTGRESLDVLWERNRNSELIKKKFCSLYGNFTHLLTIILPGPSPIVLESQITEMYEGLKLIKATNLDCKIVLRTRQSYNLDKSSTLNKFSTLPSYDKRFIIDLINFDTIEMITISDVVISCCASWSINESSMLNKKVFTFSYTNGEQFYFSDYGIDFILYSRYDILKIFKSISNDFNSIICDWHKLKNDSDFMQDGKNLERIREHINHLYLNINK